MSINLQENQESSSSSKSNVAYEVATCQKLGRYLVATRNLHKGEIILQEFPLAIAPQKNSTLICPGCFKTPNIQCPKCNWPICALDCSGSQRHEIECSFLSSGYDANDTLEAGSLVKHESANRSEEDWTSLQDTLMLLRCLNLKATNQGLWNELLDMETNWDQWSRSPLSNNAKELVEVLRKEYRILETELGTDEILRVQAILDINAYEVKMPEVNIQGCYKLASLAEHSCVPNALKTTSSTNLLLTLRAVTDIPKGTHIATTYCDVLWPTYQRQRHIQWSKFFTCKCRRCTDSGELGSYISSIICPICPIGTPTPLAPQLTSNVSDTIVEDEEEEEEDLWRNTYKDYYCYRCNTTFPAKGCECFIISAENELQDLDNECSTDGDSIANFEVWLDQWTIPPAAKTAVNENNYYKNKSTEVLPKQELARSRTRNKARLTSTPLMYLHPQHALCLDACHTVFLLYSADSCCLDELLRKDVLGTHLLQATSTLFSGISMFRGTIMYEMAMTKAALFARYLDDGCTSDHGLRVLAKDVLYLLSESIDHLQYESEDQPEGKLCILGIKQLEEFQQYLKEIIPDL